MPRLPFADPGSLAPVDTPTGLPDNSQRIAPTPGAFGAQVGQATQQLGAAGQKIGEQLLDEHNQATLNDAYSQYQSKLNAIGYGNPGDPNAAPGYFAKKGADALSGYQDALKAADQARMDILGSMPNAGMAGKFDEIARRLQTNTLEAFGRHAVAEQSSYNDNASNAAVKSSNDTALLNYNDPVQFQNSLADSSRTIIAMGQRNGWAPEVVNHALDENKSQLFAGVAQRKAQANPLDGWDFFQQHQGSMTAADQVAQGVAAEAGRQGVDPGLALTTAAIESGTGARTQNPTSAAFGVFGMMPTTWAAQGGSATNRGDVGRQIQLGVKNLADSQQQADAAVGGKAQPWQAYLVHQQGAAGGPALLKAPDDEPAVAALAPAYGGNAAMAQRAITGNGGTADMTAGQFRQMWQQRYANAASGVKPPAGGANTATSTTPGVPVSDDPRAHVTDWLDQAQQVRDPLGQNDPAYTELVQSRIRAKVGEIEYGQAQQQRAAQNVLLSAAMGVPNIAASPVGGASPLVPVASSPGGTPASLSAPMASKPTSIDQLLADPYAKAAWAQATPEVQRSILGMVEHNARGEDPPVTQASMSKLYELQGQAANDPDGFARVNLADPALVGLLPHSQLLGLMHQQASAQAKSATQETKGVNLVRAVQVLKPDLLAAGIQVDGLKPGSTQATTLNTFTGRLSAAVQDWQDAHSGKLPNDADMKGIGGQLLLQGTQRGTESSWRPSWLGGGATSVREFQVPPEQFAPTVPAQDRQQIGAAFQQRFGRAPSDTEAAAIYLAGRTATPASGSRPRTAPRAPSTVVANPFQNPAFTPQPGAPGMAPAGAGVP